MRNISQMPGFPNSWPLREFVLVIGASMRWRNLILLEIHLKAETGAPRSNVVEGMDKEI